MQIHLTHFITLCQWKMSLTFSKKKHMLNRQWNCRLLLKGNFWSPKTHELSYLVIQKKNEAWSFSGLSSGTAPAQGFVTTYPALPCLRKSCLFFPLPIPQPKDSSLSKKPHLFLWKGDTCTDLALRHHNINSPHVPRCCLFPIATSSLPLPPFLAQLTLFIPDHLWTACVATCPANLFLSTPLLQSIFPSSLSSPSCKTIYYSAFSEQCKPGLSHSAILLEYHPAAPTPSSPILMELQLLKAKPLFTGLDVSVFQVLSVKPCCSCF